MLKIRDHELKAREEQLAKDRELLDKAWQELRLEKEKANVAALRIRQREEEIKSVTKVSRAPAARSRAFTSPTRLWNLILGCWGRR